MFFNFSFKMSKKEYDCVLNKANRGSKRKINLENWKDLNNKKLRNSGKQYINRKNNIVPAKKAPDQVKWKNVLSA